LFLFYFKDFHVSEKSRDKPRRGLRKATLGDMSNLYQGPEDALTKAGIITDDKIICDHNYSARLPSDRNELEIFLFPYHSFD
jgi:Holliday junction resolvase RusA-like endonuclease